MALINGIDMNLEEIANMSKEEVSNLRKQTVALQEQLSKKRRDLREGNFLGENITEKKQNYEVLKQEIDKLIQQIEVNQQILEAYVQAKVERGDFKELGIKDMDDFAKAAQVVNDQAIQNEQKVLEKTEEAQKKLAEAERLSEINNLIERRNELEEQVKEIAKEIEKIKQQIEENENRINVLIKRAGIATEQEEQEDITKEIDELGNSNIKLEGEKKKLISKNGFKITLIRGIDIQLKEKGVEKTDTQSLQKTYKENEDIIKENTEAVKDFLDNQNIDYSTITPSEAIESQIKYRKERIEEFNQRKEQMEKIGEKMKTQQRGTTQQQSAGTPPQQGENSQIRSGISQQQSVGIPQQGNNNLPVVTRNDSLLSRAKNRITKFIDRFNPKLKEQRMQFVKEVYPDLDEETVSIIANDKDKVAEWNDLIKSGVTPQVYTKNQESAEISSRVEVKGNIISQEASAFISLLEKQAEIGDPANGHSETEKAMFDRYISDIRHKVEETEEREQ